MDQRLRALLRRQFFNTSHWWILPVKLQLVEYFTMSISYLTFAFEVLHLIFRINTLFEMKKFRFFQYIKASVGNNNLYLAIFQMCHQKVKGTKYFKTEAQVLMMHLLPIILIEIPDDHTVSENRETFEKQHPIKFRTKHFHSFLRIWCARILLGKKHWNLYHRQTGVSAQKTSTLH